MSAAFRISVGVREPQAAISAPTSASLSTSGGNRRRGFGFQPVESAGAGTSWSESAGVISGQPERVDPSYLGAGAAIKGRICQKARMHLRANVPLAISIPHVSRILYDGSRTAQRRNPEMVMTFLALTLAFTTTTDVSVD